jgi:CheY-like chemotaxis protein
VRLIVASILRWSHGQAGFLGRLISGEMESGKTEGTETLKRNTKVGTGISVGTEISRKKKMTRILIADDNAIIRGGLLRLLQSHEDWEVCGEARDGQEAVDKSRELDPDVVVLDFLMPGLNGIEAAKEISGMRPDTPILMWTMYLTTELCETARRAGVRGILAKGDVGELFSGVETLLGGGTFFAPVQ